MNSYIGRNQYTKHSTFKAVLLTFYNVFEDNSILFLNK